MELGRYDGSLQMFVAGKPLEPRMNHLRDLRQRAEKGEFGPKPLSAPRGEYLFKLTDTEIVAHIANQSKEERLRAHIAITGGK